MQLFISLVSDFVISYLRLGCGFDPNAAFFSLSGPPHSRRPEGGDVAIASLFLSRGSGSITSSTFSHPNGMVNG